MKKRVVSIGILIAGIWSAGAGAIFVAPGGHDSNGNGTQAQPYQTLEKAAENAQPGDTIFLRGNGGPFTRKVTLRDIAGAADNWITIMPYHNEHVVFDPQQNPMTNCESGQRDGILNLLSCSYLVFSGCELRNSCSRGIVVFDGNHVTLRDLYVHHIQGGIGLRGDHITFEGCEVHDATLKNYEGRLETGWAWPAVCHTHPGWGKNHTDQKNIVFRNNHIYNSWGEGFIALRADGVLVENNRFGNLWSIMTYIDYGKNVTIRNNYYYVTDTIYNRKANAALAGPATAIAWSTEGDSNGPNYKTDRPIENISIYNNIVTGAFRGIQYAYYKNNDIVNQTYKDISIAHNVFIDIQDRVIHADNVPEGKPQPENIRFVNNIAYDATKGYGNWPVDIVIGNPFDPDKQNDVQAWTFKNNCWVDGIPETGTHQNSITGDPEFVKENPMDPADFALSPGSPVIGAGMPIEDFGTDFFGNHRSATNPALGPVASEGPVVNVLRMPKNVTLGGLRQSRRAVLYDIRGRRAGPEAQKRLQVLVNEAGVMRIIKP